LLLFFKKEGLPFSMTPEDRRFALRMIPYGVHVVTAVDASGAVAAATVHWVTQTSFEPPLLAMALPPELAVYAAIRSTQAFALHMLGREDAAEALTFQDGVADMADGLLSGWGVSRARSGLPLLHNAVAVVECGVLAVLEYGDHHMIVAQVIESHVRLPPLDRPDQMILHLRDLGETIFYGG
jgi:flavin reductase (DIM6/NTAB) family NADH-FMN oxidoreductase RutF